MSCFSALAMLMAEICVRPYLHNDDDLREIIVYFILRLILFFYDYFFYKFFLVFTRSSLI